MSLCLSCNLCCDGTIFTHVKLTPEDQAAFAPEELCDVEGGHIALAQRCHNLGADGACAIYDNRPSKCRAFDCALLKHVEEGALSESFAQLVIAETKAATARSHRLFDEFLAASDRNIPSLRLKMLALDAAYQRGDVPEPAFALAQKAFLYVRLVIEDHFKGPKDEDAG